MNDHLRDVQYVFLSGCLNVYILLFLGGANAWVGVLFARKISIYKLHMNDIIN